MYNTLIFIQPPRTQPLSERHIYRHLGLNIVHWTVVFHFRENSFFSSFLFTSSTSFSRFSLSNTKEKLYSVFDPSSALVLCQSARPPNSLFLALLSLLLPFLYTYTWYTLVCRCRKPFKPCMMMMIRVVRYHIRIMRRAKFMRISWMIGKEHSSICAYGFLKMGVQTYAIIVLYSVSCCISS